jgi:hypothetical protein
LTATQDVQDGGPFQTRAAEFLGVNHTFFKRFWTIYRHGIQHQGMIKTTTLNGRLYSWRIDASYPSLPAQLVVDGVCVICINPWGWTQKMIDIWLADPVRLEEQTTHRLGQVFSAPQAEPTSYPLGSEYP